MKRLFFMCLGLLMAPLIFAQDPIFNQQNLPQGTRQVNSIEIQNGKNVWVGTSKGLLKITDQGTHTFIDSIDGQKFNIKRVALDPKGNIWLGTRRNSVIRLDANDYSFKEYPLNQFNTERANQEVRAIGFTDKGVWTGTSRGKIRCLNQTTGKSDLIPSKFSVNVNDLIGFSDTIGVVARDNGVFTLDKEKKWKFFMYVEEAYAVKKHRGAYWLLGKNMEGQFVLLKSEKLEDWVEYPLNCVKKKGKVRLYDLDFDRQGNIWIGSDEGLLKYNPNTKTCSKINRQQYPDFKMGRVESVAVQNDTTVWAGATNNGLIQIIFPTKVEEEKEDLSLRKDLTSFDDIKCNDTLALSKILFLPSSNKFKNKSEAEGTLSIIVSYLNAYPEHTVELYGHTDNFVDNPEYLKELSGQRVNRVKLYLTENGIKKARITTKAFGGEQPLYKGGKKEERALNRRVEMKILCD